MGIRRKNREFLNLGTHTFILAFMLLQLLYFNFGTSLQVKFHRSSFIRIFRSHCNYTYIATNNHVNFFINYDKFNRKATQETPKKCCESKENVENRQSPILQ